MTDPADNDRMLSDRDTDYHDEARPVQPRGAPVGGWGLPLAGTVALVASRLAPLAPLVTWSSRSGDVHATLERSPMRLALSPVTSTLEGLSLLPSKDHLAIAVSIVLAATVWGAVTSPSDATRWQGRRRRVVRFACAGAFAFATAYLAGALAPWPMARLNLEDRDELAVDFHSHTRQSHDGRWDFTLERNREWHRQGGFDVAYVTDHADSAAAVPRYDTEHDGLVHEGPVMLGGAEFCSTGAHVVRLGRADDPGAVMLLTTPFPVPSLERLQAAGTVVAGVEVADASPRGLQWMMDPSPPLAQAAAMSTLVPIASSNLHGWGRTVAAWSVLRLPGWRSNSPEQLDARIRGLLRSRDRGDARVILRNSQRLAAGGTASTALALPRLAWSVLRSLDNEEVGIWLAWLWAPTVVALLLSWLGAPGRARAPIPAGAGAWSYEVGASSDKR